MPNKKKITLLTIFILGQIGIGIGVFFYLKKEENKKITNVIEKYTDDTISKVQDVIDIIKYDLDRTANFLSAYNNELDLKTYENIIHISTLPIKQNINAYFWIPRVYNNQIGSYNNYLNSVKKNVFLSQINGTAFIHVTNRTEYYPFTLVTPKASGLDNLIGFDLMSAASTKTYIDGTPKDGLYYISRRTSLNVNNTKNNFGFFVLKAAHINGVEIRNNSNLIGYVGALINTVSLFTRIIEYSLISRSSIEVLIFDKTVGITRATNNSVLYREPKYGNIYFDEDLDMPDFSVKRYVEVINRNWSVNFIFTESYVTSTRDFFPESILIAILVFFLLVDIISYIINMHITNLNILKDTEKKQRIIEEKQKMIANKMLGYVNHEIRNPLNGIVGLLQLTTITLENIQKTKQKISINEIDKELGGIISDLSTANRSCELLTHIVNDILDIRKLEEQKMILTLKDINLSKFFIDFKKIISSKINEKPHLLFEINLFEDNYILYTDYFRLIQLLLNYVTNSIKFTNEGYIKINVIKKEHEVLHFEIIDTGRGIIKEAQHRIFHPFEQTENEDSSRYGGIGLGLYLCKMLIECMNGTTGFTSKFLKGSTFWFEIPNKKSDTLMINEKSDIEIIV